MNSKNELGLALTSGGAKGSSESLPSSTGEAGRVLFLNGGKVSCWLSRNADPIRIAGELWRRRHQELFLSRRMGGTYEGGSVERYPTDRGVTSPRALDRFLVSLRSKWILSISFSRLANSALSVSMSSASLVIASSFAWATLFTSLRRTNSSWSRGVVSSSADVSWGGV